MYVYEVEVFIRLLSLADYARVGRAGWAVQHGHCIH